MTDQERIAALEEQVQILQQHILSVAWLHHELVLGMKLAAVRKAMSGMTREQLAERITQDLRQKSQSQSK